MTDKRYFRTHTKGEVAEYKQDLNSTDKSKQKDALKKVIAAMTVGKDVSMLFADVTRCMQTDDLELKKLVYLYLINYAKSQPEMAILAVNTFVKDSMDNNPLIRALAVRTMGCIRVDKITEYLCDPLEKALKDRDPYVRKTAAIAVAKLYDMNPELVEERGFLATLKDMTADAVPMVVSNAVAALQEISDISGAGPAVFSKASTGYFVNALDQCTEWGQVYLLETLAAQEPATSDDAEGIVARVLTRLQHANSAVVLAAVKVVLAYMAHVPDEGVRAGWLRKMAPALVTLLSAEPEIQYVALRNINLVLQKYPQVLEHEVKVFFCKYNDPIYVKLEKLDIMVRLANTKNVEQVLAELKEYAQEVDVDFVRKSVSCIGKVAICFEEAAQRCITTLLELIKMKVSYVVQEAVIVIKDIFRRYPNRYEAIITDLCESLEVLEEPEAKAGMMWIIGEYADRIENADELLSYFLDSFPDEPANVQLQLLTATVKLFLKKPTEMPQQMISQVLTCATLETDNPDLRDRAYMYWRMLSNMPQDAALVVLAEKPMIEGGTNGLEPEVLDALLKQMSTLASVFHRLPSTFVKRTRQAVQTAEELEEKRLADAHEASGGDTLNNSAVAAAAVDAGTPSASGAASPHAFSGSLPATAAAAAPQGDLLGDLLGGDDDGGAAPAAAAAAPSPSGNGIDDMLSGLDLGGAPTPAGGAAQPRGGGDADPFGLDDLGGSAPPPQAAAGQPELPLLSAAEAASGCEVRGALFTEYGRAEYRVQLTNRSDAAMSGFMIQFNKNLLGLGPVAPAVPIAELQPGESAHAAVPLHVTADKLNASADSCAIALAFKFAQAGVIYLTDTVRLEQVALPEGKIEASTFLKDWGTLTTSAQHTLSIALPDAAAVQASLESRQCYTLATRPVPGTDQVAMYVTYRLLSGPQVLLELKYAVGSAPVSLTVKSENPALGVFVVDMLNTMFDAQY